jgi:hypothetical protein
MRPYLLASALLLTACQASEPPGSGAVDTNSPGLSASSGNSASEPDRPVSSDEPQLPRPQPSGPTKDCPILRSSDWHAHVDAMPGTNPRLIVSGKVTVPTGGYELSLRMGQVAESYPVQVTVYLDAIPPKGAATQALETRGARGAWPSEQRVGSVTVRCGSRFLATISNVVTAL